MAKILKSNEFKGEVLDAAGVVVVDFFATWCGPCSMLGPVFEELGKELEGKAKFVKVDIDEGGDIAQEFGVSSVPTMKIFKNGEVVDTIVGFMPKERLAAKINPHL